MMKRCVAAAALILAAGGAGCAGGFQRFPLAETVWRDDGDFRQFAPMPEPKHLNLWGGLTDRVVLRPIAKFFAVDPPGAAINVNAMDEVPDSTWFQNRIGMRPLSQERFLEASCRGEPRLDEDAEWVITEAKTTGATAGFMVEGPEDSTFLIKVDREGEPERATTGDVIGSILYWAAGYNAPCNRIVLFSRDQLVIGEGATTKNDIGEEIPLTWERLEEVFNVGHEVDGRYRGVASLFVPGEPIGGWQFEGVADDDPNDVIPHEDRRDVRGNYVLASWIHHYDLRDENTLRTWHDEDGDGTGYVRHWFIDFGDTLGQIPDPPGMAERIGSTGYFTPAHVFADFFTFGAIDRDWHGRELGAAGKSLGYYDVEHFDPDAWYTGLPNPAFRRGQEADRAWMARIIAQIPPDYLQAMVRAQRIDSEVVERELLRILLGRRMKILERYLRRLSPLTHPVVQKGPSGEARLCMKDLAVTADLIGGEQRPYRVRAWIHRGGDRMEPAQVGDLVRRPPDRICVTPPVVQGASPEDPAYLIVDVTGLFSETDRVSGPARLHLYQVAPGDYRVVGLERPSGRGRPGG